MTLLATIVEGEVDLADFCFLVAVVLFVVSAVVSLVNRAPLAALVPAGLAFVALGWLVL